MWYFVIPIISVLVIALLSDLRRKKKRSLDDELKNAHELGEVQAYRGLDRITDNKN